jgi:putative inorganic carbon (hco3(-)) transporter
MRDIAIFLLLLGTLPLAMARPFVGILLWSWMSFMNPHRITWGFATDMPWAMMIALSTILGCFIAQEPKRFPPGATAKLIVAFLLMTTITSLAAPVATEGMYGRWSLVFKMFSMLLLTLSLSTTRTRIHALIWMTVIAIGYFGIKGGLFALKTGGADRVYGPPGTMINDNNNLAAAMLTVLPLINYLRQQTSDWRLRIGITGVIVLTTFSIVSSQSRGALLGLIAGVGFLWSKTQNKIVSGAAILILLASVAAFMPQSWYDRMHTIQTYSESDDKSNNRLFLWETGWKLALARPLTGVGFYGTYEPRVVAQFVPDATARALHSIWFETMAEHGFPTFFVWLAFPIVGWMNARRVIKAAKGIDDLQWAIDLARMGQVSIVAFLVSCTFLSLQYYDVYFTIMIAIAATRILVDQRIAETLDQSAIQPWRRFVPGQVTRPGLVAGVAQRGMDQ